jgi:hypothetical protein
MREHADHETEPGKDRDYAVANETMQRLDGFE